jgi:hypothetical protein
MVEDPLRETTRVLASRSSQKVRSLRPIRSLLRGHARGKTLVTTEVSFGESWWTLGKSSRKVIVVH